MQRPTESTTASQGTRLLDLLPDPGSADFGSALLRLAHAAAAQHRAELADGDNEPWQGLTQIELAQQDESRHGSLAISRSAPFAGSATKEGDR